MYDVKGSRALIIAAARGICSLTAKFMAEQSCNPILHSRDELLRMAEHDPREKGGGAPGA